MSEKWSDEELERLMRRGLASRAEGMSEGATAGAAREQASRRWPMIAAAAAAVVGIAVLVPVTLGQLGDDGPGPGDDSPVAASPTASATTADDPRAVPDDWRVESWRDVSVRVPPAWGWGGGPVSGEWTEGDLVDCGAAPYVVPGSDAYEDVPQDTPYVGRPVVMTDACFGTVGGLPAKVSGDFVLLGSPYRFGVHELKDGFTAQTVEAGEQNVTVVTRDEALRKQVLSTVRVGDRDPNGCDAYGPGRARAPEGLEIDSANELTVCVYDEGGLVWSQAKGASDAQQYVDAYLASGTLGGQEPRCEGPGNVLLRIEGRTADGEAVTWRQVVNTSCGYVDSGKGYVRMTKGAARFWTGGGTAAYVPAPNGSWDWPGMFRGAIG